MKYTKEQRLDIGRRTYDSSYQTARAYMRLYRNENHLLPKCGHPSASDRPIQKAVNELNNLEAYEAMLKDDMIQELVKARIAEAQLKKVTK